MLSPQRSKELELTEVCMFFSDMEGIRVANFSPMGTKIDGRGRLQMRSVRISVARDS